MIDLRLGDTVSGIYFGVPFTGILDAYDSSGYVYVRFPTGFSRPVVCGFERNGIGIDPWGEDRRSLRLVFRPEQKPEVELAPWQVIGGAYLKETA